MDLGTEIVGAIIVFIAGFLGKKVVGKIKLRSYRRFWKPFVKDKKTICVLSSRKGPYDWSSSRISFPEVKAYKEGSLLWKSIGLEVKLEESFSLTEEMKQSNLILIGSPVANSVVNTIWNSLSDQHPFNFNKTIQLVNTVINGQERVIELNEYFINYHDENFIPKRDENYESEQKWKEDYGIIARFKHPFNNNKKIILAMGCHGNSTNGSFKTLVNESLTSQIVQKVGKHDFFALVKFRLEDNEAIFSGEYPKFLKWHIL